jgi:transcriptional regulator GlxA family with amidase domain
MVAEAAWRNFQEPLDTVLVVAGPDVTHQIGNIKLVAWIRSQTTYTRRIGSVCTGAFILAEAGLPNNHRATTPWKAAERLQQTYPNVLVEPDAIYVRDGTLYTSAGIDSVCPEMALSPDLGVMLKK